MKPSFSAFTAVRLAAACLTVALLGMGVTPDSAQARPGLALATVAQVYNGPGLQEGANSAAVTGIQNQSLRVVVAGIVNRILTYVALAAVVVIVIAGIYLILSFGNDSAKETAKKIVIYTAIGLVLILVSKALVAFFISLVS